MNRAFRIPENVKVMTCIAKGTNKSEKNRFIKYVAMIRKLKLKIESDYEHKE